MRFLHSVGRFLGPWLTFGLLSGLASGFAYGAIATLGCLVAAIASLGDFSSSGEDIGSALIAFVLTVLGCVGFGLLAGFCPALIAALVGGRIGFWWGVIVSFVAVFTGYLYYLPLFDNFTSRGFDPTLPIVAFPAVFGICLPLQWLVQKAETQNLLDATRRFLQESWLTSPPQSARLVGILLPGLIYAARETALVKPEFDRHTNYLARMGTLGVWQKSREVIFARRSYHGRASCQSNLRQIMLGVKQYVQDYDEYYPAKPTSPQQGVGAVLQPYLKTTYIFQCPQEFYSYQGNDFRSGDFTDYWYNARIYGVSESRLTYISNTLSLGDGNTGGGEANASYSLSTIPLNFPPALRHLNGANYTFADGHVKWLKPGFITVTPPTSSSFSMLPN